jgi:uncharacterized protein YjiK
MPTIGVKSVSFSGFIGGTERVFKAFEQIKIDLEEPSDLFVMSNGALCVVSDTSAQVEAHFPSGAVETFKLDEISNKASGLEAACYDPEKGHLFVVCEEKDELFRYDLKASRPLRASLDKMRALGSKGDKNKGIEGIAYLPKTLSPTGAAQLVVAKEGNPRALFLLDDSGKGPRIPLELDKHIKNYATDFSAVTVHPTTGHLYVASDEASHVVELEIVRRSGGYEARLVGAAELRDTRGAPLERVEGIAFDASGTLCVVLENARKILRMQLSDS